MKLAILHRPTYRYASKPAIRRAARNVVEGLDPAVRRGPHERPLREGRIFAAQFTNARNAGLSGPWYHVG